MSQYAFVYQPGGVPLDNVYDDWATLIAAMSAISGPKRSPGACWIATTIASAVSAAGADGEGAMVIRVPRVPRAVVPAALDRQVPRDPPDRQVRSARDQRARPAPQAAARDRPDRQETTASPDQQAPRARQA
jgi:hypothetical protein